MSGTVWLASYVGLWVAVGVLCLVVMGLLRQVGVLHERLGAKVSEPVGDGLPVGTPAPMPGRLGYNRARATLLAFTSEASAACEQLGPVLERIERQYKGVRVVEVPFGSRTRDVFAAFNVASTPRLISVDGAGVVRACGVAATLDQAEDVLARALDGAPIPRPEAEADVDLREGRRGRRSRQPVAVAVAVGRAEAEPTSAAPLYDQQPGAAAGVEPEPGRPRPPGPPVAGGAEPPTPAAPAQPVTARPAPAPAPAAEPAAAARPPDSVAASGQVTAPATRGDGPELAAAAPPAPAARPSAPIAGPRPSTPTAPQMAANLPAPGTGAIPVAPTNAPALEPGAAIPTSEAVRTNPANPEPAPRPAAAFSLAPPPPPPPAAVPPAAGVQAASPPPTRLATPQSGPSTAASDTRVDG